MFPSAADTRSGFNLHLASCANTMPYPSANAKKCLAVDDLHKNPKTPCSWSDLIRMSLPDSKKTNSNLISSSPSRILFYTPSVLKPSFRTSLLSLINSRHPFLPGIARTSHQSRNLLLADRCVVSAAREARRRALVCQRSASSRIRRGP
jgi:hypothetical protein